MSLRPEFEACLMSELCAPRLSHTREILPQKLRAGFDIADIALYFPCRKKCIAFIIMSKLPSTLAEVMPKVGVNFIDI